MWIAVVLIFVGAIVYLFKSCLNAPRDMVDGTSRIIRESGRALSEVAAAFRRGTVTTSFVSYATTISNQHYLQFATLKQMELFTRSEAPSLAFGYSWPEVVVEARAPVEYSYYLDLNAEWKFVLENNTIHAHAPPIRFNKPAVDVSAMTYEVKRGYFKTTEVQENLKRSVTSLVTVRAKENIPLVRETGRKQTADFIERWLARSFTDASNYNVKVYFPDEKPPERIKVESAPQ